MSDFFSRMMVRPHPEADGNKASTPADNSYPGGFYISRQGAQSLSSFQYSGVDHSPI